MNALIENRIGDRAQAHLELLHFHFGPAIALLRHHLFAINRPTFDERSALENCADQCRRAEFVGVAELQIMSGHRFVDREIAHHEVVVFTEERFLAGLRPIVRRGRDREKGFPIFLERTG